MSRVFFSLASLWLKENLRTATLSNWASYSWKFPLTPLSFSFIYISESKVVIVTNVYKHNKIPTALTNIINFFLKRRNSNFSLPILKVVEAKHWAFFFIKCCTLGCHSFTQSELYFFASKLFHSYFLTGWTTKGHLCFL